MKFLLVKKLIISHLKDDTQVKTTSSNENVG